MLIPIAVGTVVLCWGAGIVLVCRALTSRPVEKFEPLAPDPESVTLNQDLGGLV